MISRFFSQSVPPQTGVFLAAFTLFSFPQTTHADEPLSSLKIQTQATPFPLDQVRLSEGIFKDRLEVDADYLLHEVDPDRLLSGFREQAGLPKKADRYGGWEARGINGHSLGHFLSALSALYASTGNPLAKERADYVVSELAACQQANGDGYVLPVAKRVYDEVRAGHIKAGGFSLNDWWVPNYTLHKVFAGLRDAWRLTGNQQALDVETKLGLWLHSVNANLTDAQLAEIMRCEFGGMNEVLADLTADTGNPLFLQMANRDFNDHRVLDPLRRGNDDLNGLHANTQIPKIVGLARTYEMTGDNADRTAVETFWKSVVNERSFCIGGHSTDEHFFPVDQFPEKVTNHTAETCNTNNMLKLTSHLFSWEPSAAQMDFAERALINHLLAHIGPEPGEFGYFLGLDSVGKKVFSTEFDSWWCCVGTGMENPAHYAELAYYKSHDTLWVNLYLGTRLDWKEEGVKLVQDTLFPDADSSKITLRMEGPKSFALKLRHPAWCTRPEIRLNGKPVEVTSSPSSYFTIERTWHDGDTLSIHLPMHLYLEPLPHSDDKITAIMYGPLVLAGIVPPDSKDPTPDTIRWSDHLKAPGKTDQTPPVIVTGSDETLLNSLKPTGKGFATFHSRGLLQPADLDFMPLHRVYNEHYAVYFDRYTNDSWKTKQQEVRAEQERLLAIKQATVDEIQPGFQQSEVEHKFEDHGSRTGEYRNRKWRDASNGASFSYEVAVVSNDSNELLITYWGDNRGRTFDITIDGKRLLTETIPANHPGQFFEKVYPLNRAFTQGKNSVRVGFVAPSNGTAGGIFGLRVMKSKDYQRLYPKAE